MTCPAIRYSSSMSEQWRDIPGFPNYQASSLGRIRAFGHVRRRERVLAGTLDKSGRRSVDISGPSGKRPHRVHILIALAFLGPRPEWATLVRHYDGDNQNNVPGNLRWGTHSLNGQDEVRLGRHYQTLKTHCPRNHEYTPENTYLQPRKPPQTPARVCKTCRNRQAREAYHAKK